MTKNKISVTILAGTILIGLGFVAVQDTNNQAFAGSGLDDVNGGFFLGTTCSDPGVICKSVSFTDAGEDEIINVGERVEFQNVVMVINPSQFNWDKTTMSDRFGAEINVSGCETTSPDTAPTTVTLTTKGKSEKEFLKWDIGTLLPGQSVLMICAANTDLNPAGNQEYSSPGEYEFNSGAVLKFFVNDKQRSFETGGISVVVECSENEEVDSKTGDCVCKPGFEENPIGICVSATG